MHSIALELHEHLLQLSCEHEDAPQLDWNQEPPVNWEEGTEELNSKTTDELWTMLGLHSTKVIPDFNEYVDVNMHNYWTDPKYMEEHKEELRGLSPRWHQLVGIVKIVFHAFKGEPLMLMDEVGVGKTLQLVGAFCVLNFFHDFYAKNKKFPGAYGESNNPMVTQLPSNL